MAEPDTSLSSSDRNIRKSAIELFHKYSAQYSDTHPLTWKISYEASLIIEKWKLSDECFVASLMLPLLSECDVDKSFLIRMFGHKVVDLALRVVNWQQSTSNGSLTLSSETHSYHLRWLYREAYLDLPNLHFIFLLIATHDVRLRVQATREVAEECISVFLPFIDMLGIWSLHRSWLELSTSILKPDDYNAIINEIGEEEIFTSGDMRNIFAKRKYISEKETLTTAEKDWLMKNRRIIKKSEFFVSLLEDLNTMFKSEGVWPTPRVQPRMLQPGAIIQKISLGEFKDELLSRLSIRIFCNEQTDCYRVLGILHTLLRSKPIAPRFSERFDDYIADPQPNGYAGLHTAINYYGDYGETLIDVRILTPKMHRTNELGIIALFNKKPIATQHKLKNKVWWSQLERLTDELNRRFNFPVGTSFVKWLSSLDLGSISNPLYVFTPKGEVVLLAQNGTPLDFAYSIHSELGHHASRIRVNGNLAPYNFPLHNGDLVYVHYEPRSTGPDLSWLTFVSTSYAKTQITRQLFSRAQQIHPGRNLILNSLQKLVDYYKKKRGYEFRITSTQLDNFLYRLSKKLMLSNITALYEMVLSNKGLPHRIAHRLISNELTNLLVDYHGNSLTKSGVEIILCDICRPLPSDTIIGVMKQKKTFSQQIRVHNVSSLRCIKNVQITNTQKVNWVNNNNSISNEKEMVIFKAEGEDRPELLRDILTIFYAQNDVNLNKVDARSYPDGSANIELIVRVVGHESIAMLQQLLQNVSHIHHVWSLPVSVSQQLILSTSATTANINPYLEYEVYDRLNFYNRDEQIQVIRDWLQMDDPAPWLILHGQRRVGKSSLTKYLLYETFRQPALALPVLINLQSLSSYNTPSLVYLIGEAVYRTLRKPIPIQNQWEEPIVWLRRILLEAIKLTNREKIFIMIDEFNVLVEAENNGDLNPNIYKNLKALMAESLPIRWLLVVQDNEYMNPVLWGSAFAIFQQGYSLSLNNLDFTHADKLIQEPIKRCGLHFRSNTIPQKIFYQTSGNPYLIKSLCYHLVELARNKDQSHITDAEYDQVIYELLSEGERYFDHFNRQLNKEKRMLLQIVSQHSNDQGLIEISQLVMQIKSSNPKYETLNIYKIIEELVLQGILFYSTNKDLISISIPLFSQWLKYHFKMIQEF